jgi:hypothetical protein
VGAGPKGRGWMEAASPQLPVRATI